jgi:hypothetical protein
VTHRPLVFVLNPSPTSSQLVSISVSAAAARALYVIGDASDEPSASAFYEARERAQPCIVLSGLACTPVS